MTGSSQGGTARAVPPPQPAAAGGLQAVLFDMDGLLVDSEPLWYETECAVMARLGAGWTHADQQHLIGGSLSHSVGYMLSTAARPATPEEVGGWLVDGMADLVRRRGVPFKPGAARLLAEVSAAGLPHALVTSAERVIVESVLAVTGLSVTAVVCGDDVRERKPDPEPYLRAAALLGADPARCVALDDSPPGVASAEAAGCPVIAVPSVPIPGRPGRLTAGSLTEVTLATLRAMVPG